MSFSVSELVTTPLDKCRSLPKETHASYRGAPVWHATAAADFPEPAGGNSDRLRGNFPMRDGRPAAEPADYRVRNLSGVFPQGFLPWALRLLGRPRRCLHVCSGALERRAGQVRVDVRDSMRPDVVADGRQLPFALASFDAALIDPPYSLEYAEVLYGTEYPRPSHLLAEASRCVRPCGRIGILHFLVPRAPEGASHLGVWGVTTGPGYRIRAFTVFEMRQDLLPLEARR